MASHNVEGLMGVSVEKIRGMVDADTVVGTPINLPDGTTLIPVSKISYGFASGGSDLPSKSNAELFGGGPDGGSVFYDIGGQLAGTFFDISLQINYLRFFITYRISHSIADIQRSRIEFRKKYHTRCCLDTSFHSIYSVVPSFYGHASSDFGESTAENGYTETHVTVEGIHKAIAVICESQTHIRYIIGFCMKLYIFIQAAVKIACQSRYIRAA